jgi:hypothetical protein
MVEILQVATAVAGYLAPFLPSLMKMGEAAGEKLAETVGEKGGDAAWKTAEGLWAKLKARFSQEPALQGAATLVASQPEDETYRTVLAKALSQHLEKDPDLARDLADLLGGDRGIQEVLSENRSWVENVAQEMGRSGTQRVRASDESTIRSVRQKMSSDG